MTFSEKLLLFGAGYLGSQEPDSKTCNVGHSSLFASIILYLVYVRACSVSSKIKLIFKHMKNEGAYKNMHTMFVCL